MQNFCFKVLFLSLAMIFNVFSSETQENKNAVVVSKYLNDWQRNAGADDLPMKLALVVKRQQNQFPDRKIILHKNDELWIETPLSDSYFKSAPIVKGRCLSQQDCQNLCALLQQQNSSSKDILVKCSYQLTHFIPAVHNGWGAQFDAVLKITPEIRKAIEQKAEGVQQEEEKIAEQLLSLVVTISPLEEKTSFFEKSSPAFNQSHAASKKWSYLQILSMASLTTACLGIIFWLCKDSPAFQKIIFQGFRK